MCKIWAVPLSLKQPKRTLNSGFKISHLINTKQFFLRTQMYIVQCQFCVKDLFIQTKD